MRRNFCFLLLAMIFISCNDNSSGDYDNTVPMPKVSNVPSPAPMIFKVVNVYPHDPSAFTQGLEFYKGKLYESTGEFNRSRLRIVNIKTGEPEKSHTITDPKIFGEGITILDGKIYQLTWQNHKIFEYDLRDITKPLRIYNWSREGWGATNNGKELIISDGTAQLFFVSPDPAKAQMQIHKILTVRDNRGEVDSLNELELINGYVYANIWLTNNIVKIDTSNGYVVGKMDMTGIMQQYAPEVNLKDEAVLNGIAYDSVSNKMYITGKDWPRLFEIELVR